MYLFPETYITAELAEQTKYKSIQNAYDRNQLSVIVRGSFWYAACCPERVFATVKKEMKRLYPLLTFLYENDAKDVDGIRTETRNTVEDIWGVKI